MAISASTPSEAIVARTASSPPSCLSGFVRDEPRIVPPRGKIPRTAATSSGLVAPVRGPCHPSANPTKSMP